MRIEQKAVPGMMLTLLLVGLLTLAFNIKPVKASGSIYIRSDGSIDPPTAPIQRNGYIYTLTANIYDSIVVQKDNILVDGGGHIIQGIGNGIGIDLAARNNVTVKNTKVQAFIFGIYLNHSLSNSIVRNNITANNFESIRLYESLNNSITGNIVTANKLDGIVLYGSLNNKIAENNITNNYDGVRLYKSSNNTITGNIIASNYYGIFLAMSSNNILARNTAEANQGGIDLVRYSNKNSIIQNNLVANNWYGVRLNESLDGIIYHNNFVDNAHQVYTNYSMNIWDDGYPSGGNYWTAYTGLDQKTGPNQDVPGSDGIGDTPYVIDANDRDRYPLMKPWSPITEPPGIYILVPYHRQVKSYYCGPAALEMVFDFYGPDIPQLEIADVARTASDGTYTCDMVRAAHFSNLSTSVGDEMQGNITGYTARKLGYAAFEHGGLTINELKSLIAAGYPIIVLTTWHYRVAVGYDSTHITFQDSFYGKMINMTYQELDIDWNYSGHWGLFVSPWNIKVSTPKNVLLGDVFNVTASITYPSPLPFNSNQYPASVASATVALPAGLALVSGETAKKTIDTGSLAAGALANVTWAVRAYSLGNYTISVEAEGKVTGFVPPLPSYPGSYTYEDRTGGFGESIVTVSGDKIPPSTFNDYDGLWHTTDFSITLTALDDLSGVAETAYKINDGPTKTVRSDGQPLIITEGANNMLEYWSVDNVGNEESNHILTGIKLDKTAPEGSVTIDNNAVYSTSTSVTLTLTAADATAGVYKVRCSNDGVWDTEPWEDFSTTKTWTLPSGDGTKTVYYKIKDNAGLISIYSDTIILDSTPPTGSITIAGGATYTNSLSVTLTLSAEDATSGVAHMHFSNDNTTWTSWETYSSSKAWALTLGDGIKTVCVQYMDSGGLVSSSYLDTITLDATKPTANAGQNLTVQRGTTLTFDASKSSDNVGIVSYEWDFGDGTTGAGKTITHMYANPGIYKVTLTVKDNAGSIGRDSINVRVLSYFEVFPWWVLGVIALGIAIGVILFWRRRSIKS